VTSFEQFQNDIYVEPCCSLQL